MSTLQPEPASTVVADARFRYPTPCYPKQFSECRLRIFNHEGKHVAIATELVDNPGASVTNTAEDLWGAVMQEWEFDTEHTALIEHYPGDPSEKIRDREETLDL